MTTGTWQPQVNGSLAPLSTSPAGEAQKSGKERERKTFGAEQRREREKEREKVNAINEQCNG